MKKTFILLFFFSTFFLSGQEYHKLINESYYWDIAFAESGYICSGFGSWLPMRFLFLGDTIINETTYSKMYYYEFINLNTPPAPNCPPFAIDTTLNLYTTHFLREDTTERKVYRYTTINQPEEILLFDFSVEVGDTVFYAGMPDAIIDTVYNFTTNDGKQRKYIGFNGNTGFPSGYYIEGIGGAGGLLGLPYHHFEGGSWTMCIQDINTNETIIDNYFCYDFISNIDQNRTITTCKIYPNPFSKSIKIELHFTNPILIEIYNVFGRKVYSTSFSNEIKLDLDFLLKGIYFIKGSTRNEFLFIEKIIKK